MMLRAVQLVRRAVAALFDKHRVLPALAWAVVIRDALILLGDPDRRTFCRSKDGKMRNMELKIRN